MTRIRRSARIRLALAAALAGLACIAVAIAARSTPAASSPIRHVVIVYQENHSFDNVLGRLCVEDSRCDGAVSGSLPGGRRLALRRAADVVPEVEHTTHFQKVAIAGGRMDGFGRLPGCRRKGAHRCYTQFRPGQVPNLAKLARRFGLSDRTFEMDAIPSWGAHLELVAQDLDGFTGDNPTPSRGAGRGWGCNTRKQSLWRPRPSARLREEPSCVPDRGLDRHRHPHGGAYRRTPVRHLPTIMDRLDAAGLGWRLYSATKAAHSPQQWNVPYGWAICPTFAGCLYTRQSRHEVPNRRVIGDAAAGRLPSFSVVLPNVRHSQHNLDSMRAGDNWIGRVVAAIENGPDWSSTAIFITYDDCGCFYDHVPPPEGLGVRVPMVIVSPYARAGFTDSRTASFSSMLAFAERTLGVAPLSERDADAYAYDDSFDFSQPPLAPVRLRSRPVGARERTWLRAHPAPPDGT